MRRIILAGAALLALSACNRDEPPAPEPGPDLTASPTPSEPVSIIRPDIEEARMVPLESIDSVLSFGNSGAELTDAARSRLREIVDSRAIEEGGAVVIRGHHHDLVFRQNTIGHDSPTDERRLGILAGADSTGLHSSENTFQNVESEVLKHGE